MKSRRVFLYLQFGERERPMSEKETRLAKIVCELSATALPTQSLADAYNKGLAPEEQLSTVVVGCLASALGLATGRVFPGFHNRCVVISDDNRSMAVTFLRKPPDAPPTTKSSA